MLKSHLLIGCSERATSPPTGMLQPLSQSMQQRNPKVQEMAYYIEFIITLSREIC
jgi:hypothetical protein